VRERVLDVSEMVSVRCGECILNSLNEWKNVDDVGFIISLLRTLGLLLEACNRSDDAHKSRLDLCLSEACRVGL
jgi:hypothetical protein